MNTKYVINNTCQWTNVSSIAHTMWRLAVGLRCRRAPIAYYCRVLPVVYIVIVVINAIIYSPLDTQKQQGRIHALDLVINVKMSCCIRIGQRSNVIRLCSVSGAFLPWSMEITYLGVHIVGAKSFKVSTDQCRRSFHRADNAIWQSRQNCLWGGGDTFDRNEMFTSLVIRSGSLSVEENLI